MLVAASLSDPFGIREHADVSDAALRALEARTTHADKGPIEVRVCRECNQPFPEWSASAAVPCPSCQRERFVARPLRHDLPIDEQVAAVAHEAIATHRAVHGAPTFPRWENAPSAYAVELVQQVRDITSGAARTPEESHAAWVARAKGEGWSYGPWADLSARTDPALRAWSDLPEDYQERWRLLVGVVTTLVRK